MSQKEKSKRKNLSPDELLQKAHLLYPENEAFVRGDSKELHPKGTIFANLRAKKYGFPISSNAFATDYTGKVSGLGVMLVILGLFLCGATSTFLTDTDIFLRGSNIEARLFGIVCINLLGISLFLAALYILFKMWKMLTFKQNKLQHDYTYLIQHGTLYLGEVVGYYKRKASTMIRIELCFKTLDDNKHNIYWYIENALSINTNVIVLYVDDKLCIVL